MVALRTTPAIVILEGRNRLLRVGQVADVSTTPAGDATDAAVRTDDSTGCPDGTWADADPAPVTPTTAAMAHATASADVPTRLIAPPLRPAAVPQDLTVAVA